MLTHIRKSGKDLMSPDAWKIRLIFWAGAVLVGVIASGFAISAVYAEDVFHTLLDYGDWVPFVLCPLGLVLVSWLTRKFFPGSQGSGIPQSIAALQLTEHTSRSALLSFRIAFGK
ncbi:hypothetical protein MNBD_GAMMA14-2260, partial [hydrothermal vent metagenome]